MKAENQKVESVRSTGGKILTHELVCFLVGILAAFRQVLDSDWIKPFLFVLISLCLSYAERLWLFELSLRELLPQLSLLFAELFTFDVGCDQVKAKTVFALLASRAPHLVLHRVFLG